MITANEIQVGSNVSANIAGQQINLGSNFQLRPNQQIVNQEIVQAPLSSQALPLGPVPMGSVGFVWIKNLDRSYSVALAVDEECAAPFAVLGPQQAIPIPAPAAQIYTKALTVAVNLQLAVFAT